MHHVVLERWSRQSSPLHRRDARAKLIAVIAYLVGVATTPPGAYVCFLSYAVLLGIAIGASRLPASRLLLRAAVVLPFSGFFAIALAAGGAASQAVAILLKSYLSASAALIAVATTPLPELLRAFAWMRVPGVVIDVAQFLYRYLFVVSEQAQHMRLAALARGGRHGFRAAGSAVSVLFARSYQRAEGVHQAMLARGFTGNFPVLDAPHWHAADLVLMAGAVGASLMARMAALWLH